MIRARGHLVVGIAAVLAVSPTLLAQSPTATRPSFAGTWEPSDVAQSDRLFDVGLSPVSGRGRLVIEQRGSDRFTVTITLPDDKLDPILDINGKFYASIIYRTTEAQGRQGGGGAGPQPQPLGWVGNTLVLANARPSRFPTTTTYSMEGERLKVETRATVSGNRTSTVTQFFTKVK